MKKKHSSAKQTSILAITIALYVVFFSISYSVTLPNFTLLYLPIILLGVFPVWFGWTGLAGSMIGAFVGGAFVERLGVLGVFESVVAFIIYFINWILLPSKPAEKGGKLRFFRLLGVLMVSLLAWTSYILWQYTVFPPLFNANEALAILVPTFLLNLPFVLIACPALLKTVSPKMRSWGMYTGNFAEWRRRRKAQS
jgi:hypothetical protein